jgi:metallophosphoesterase (TIGR00282 family)
MGRTFMKPVDDPFRAADRVVAELRRSAKVIVVDLHAEATSDKQLLGRYLDGRVSAVLGTHTHVATADEQILPNGTAYQTDVGMTGPYDSILGRRYDRVLASTMTGVPHHYDVATGDPRLCGAVVEIEPATGRALSIRRVSVDQEETRRLMTGDSSGGRR